MNYMVVMILFSISCSDLVPKNKGSEQESCTLQRGEKVSLDHEYRCRDGQVIFGRYNEKIIPDAEVDTFIVLSDGYGCHFAKDQFQVYFEDEVIVGANPANFIKLSCESGSDGNNLYFQSYVLVGESADGYEKLLSGYWRTTSSIFFENKKLYDVDIRTFHVTNLANLGQDNQNVWYQADSFVDLKSSEPISILKPDLFSAIDTGVTDYLIYQDTSRVFCIDLRSPEKNYLLSFLINQNIASIPNQSKLILLKDAASVYLNCEEVKGADPISFVELGNGYFEDNDQVFFNELEVPGALPKQFEPIRSIWGQSFYSKSQTMIYFKDTPIPEADFASFEVICRFHVITQLRTYESPSDTCGGLVGRDKNRVFDPI